MSVCSRVCLPHSKMPDHSHFSQRPLGCVCITPAGSNGGMPRPERNVPESALGRLRRKNKGMREKEWEMDWGGQEKERRVFPLTHSKCNQGCRQYVSNPERLQLAVIFTDWMLKSRLYLYCLRLFFVHSFTYSNAFILVSVAVDPEPIPRTLSTRPSVFLYFFFFFFPSKFPLLQNRTRSSMRWSQTWSSSSNMGGSSQKYRGVDWRQLTSVFQARSVWSCVVLFIVVWDWG